MHDNSMKTKQKQTRKPWTPTQIYTLLAMRAIDIPHKEIAKVVKHPWKTCKNTFSLLTNPQIAVRAKRYTRWTDKENSFLAESKLDGWTFKEIAAALNRTARAVENQYFRLAKEGMR